MISGVVASLIHGLRQIGTPWPIEAGEAPLETRVTGRPRMMNARTVLSRTPCAAPERPETGVLMLPIDNVKDGILSCANFGETGTTLVGPFFLDQARKVACLAGTPEACDCTCRMPRGGERRNDIILKVGDIVVQNRAFS